MSRARRLVEGRTIIAAMLAVACGAGCKAGSPLIASAGDYGEYRRVRVASNFDDRISAAATYLQLRPEGQYAERVRRFYEAAEPIYFKERSRTVAGLKSYLSALPAGPHADEATTTLIELRTEARREDLDTRRLRATTARLKRKKKARLAAASVLANWLIMLLDPQSWRVPLSEASAELLMAYELALPTPTCAPHVDRPGFQLCKKTVERRFSKVVDGKPKPRLVRFEIAVTLDERYQLARVDIAGQSLLVRSEEAARRSQQGSAAYVTELLEKLTEADVLCAGGTDEHEVSEIQCEGLRLVIHAAGGEGVDSMWIEPTADAYDVAGDAPADDAEDDAGDDDETEGDADDAEEDDGYD